MAVWTEMDPSPTAETGLRARKKLEKVEAIRAAARHLFSTKGFEGTTLREVAQLADVGFGTVFAYSQDKSGLLCMLVVDDLRHMPPTFMPVIGRDDVLDQLTDAFMAIYRFWARSPELSRVVLPQMEFPQLNTFAEIIRARREETKGELRAWFDAAQKTRRVRPDIDTTQAAETVFAIFTSCLREWICGDPLDIAIARRRLHRLLALPLAAIRADETPKPKRTPASARTK